MNLVFVGSQPLRNGISMARPMAISPMTSLGRSFNPSVSPFSSNMMSIGQLFQLMVSLIQPLFSQMVGQSSSGAMGALFPPFNSMMGAMGLQGNTLSQKSSGSSPHSPSGGGDLAAPAYVPSPSVMNPYGVSTYPNGNTLNGTMVPPAGNQSYPSPGSYTSGAQPLPAQAINQFPIASSLGDPFAPSAQLPQPYGKGSHLNNMQAMAHPDLNLDYRGYSRVEGPAKTLIGMNGPTDPRAPQLAGLFSNQHGPIQVTGTYRVNNWDWANNRRGGPDGRFETNMIGLKTRPGEVIYTPNSGYRINGQGKQAIVLFADQNSVVFNYTGNGNVVDGYTVHLEGIKPRPGLKAGDQVAGWEYLGSAMGDEVRVVIRDKGSFMDPRVQKDWWSNNAQPNGPMMMPQYDLSAQSAQNDPNPHGGAAEESTFASADSKEGQSVETLDEGSVSELKGHSEDKPPKVDANKEKKAEEDSKSEPKEDEHKEEASEDKD